MNVDLKLQPIKEQLARIEAKLDKLVEIKKEVKSNGRKDNKSVTDGSGE